MEILKAAYHRSGEDFAARVTLHAWSRNPTSLVREFKQLLGRMCSRPDEQTLIFSFVNMLKAGLRKQVLLRCPENGAWDSLSAVTDAAVLVESDALLEQVWWMLLAGMQTGNQSGISSSTSPKALLTGLSRNVPRLTVWVDPAQT